MNSIDNDIYLILEGKNSAENSADEKNDMHMHEKKDKISEKLIKDIMILEPSAALKFVA